MSRWFLTAVCCTTESLCWGEAFKLCFAAQFYGQGWTTANLELLSRFYEKYPEYADRTFLMVKVSPLVIYHLCHDIDRPPPGSVQSRQTWHRLLVSLSYRRVNLPRRIECPDRPENLRRSVDTCISALRGKKKIDVFQPARVDKAYTIEDIVKTLVELKNEGKFDHIGLSECSAATLRRAHAVRAFFVHLRRFVSSNPYSQVHPIAIVEIEISPTSYEEETKKGE